MSLPSSLLPSNHVSQLTLCMPYFFAAQVVCCPGGLVTGYTRFIPNEEQLESNVVTRAHMEGQLVVALAGRWVSELPSKILLQSALLSGFLLFTDPTICSRCLPLACSAIREQQVRSFHLL